MDVFEELKELDAMSSTPGWSESPPSEAGWYWIDSPYDGGLIVGHQTAPDLWFTDGKAIDPDGIKFGPRIPHPSELAALRAGMEALEGVAGWSALARIIDSGLAKSIDEDPAWANVRAALSAHREAREGK